MIEGLKPYSEYKPSEQSWLGEIPQHWSVIPNRAIFNEIKDRNYPNEEMLSVTITRGIIHQKALLSSTSKKDSSNIDKSKYKLVRAGDIAYNKMRAWQGAFGASAFRGIVSPAYVVIRPRNGATAWFYHYLYRTPAFAKEAERWSYGITSDMWSLRPEHFKVIYTVRPPSEEQEAIVRFLDHANRKIKCFIRIKKRLIGLLNEQKHAIIYQSVTRGINPSISLKPSKSKWLGEIPEHWSVHRAKFLLHQINSPIPKNAEQVTCFRDGQVTLRRNRRTEGFTNAVLELGYQGIWPGQLVLHSMDAFAGAIGISDSRGKCSPEYVICEPAMEGVLLDYYAYLLRSLALRGFFLALCPSVRERAPRVRFSHFRAFILPKPPIDEQKSIVDYISHNIKDIDSSLESFQKEIDLIQEYCTRLIADIVTGKLDVREAAAKLQDLPPEPTTEKIEDETIEDLENEVIHG